ncbi:MAG: hypothetical protein RLZZ182_412 [Pseudomonadota bacterium]|jgi:hypothetical protein
MTTREFSFWPVSIGGGMSVSRAWVQDQSPIALVQVVSKTGVESKSRLDLQKAMFIDPLPSKPRQHNIRGLVHIVVTQLKWQIGQQETKYERI